MDVATLTNFSRMLRTLERQADHFTIALPSDWLQGRTAYGGLSAALCLQATLRTFPDLPPLRSAQFSFIGPATGALRVTANMLRQGKSTAFTSADLEGENGLAARATFCFGADRSLAFNFANVPMPIGPSLEKSSSYYDWPTKPNFMSHFEGRLAAGARPGTPGARPEMLVWLRHRNEEIDGSLVSLLALADAYPQHRRFCFPNPRRSAR
jgi:hypothetical protein